LVNPQNAAKDARERMATHLGGDPGQVVATTLHSCAVRLLGAGPMGEKYTSAAPLEETAFKKAIGESFKRDLEGHVEEAILHVRRTTPERDRHQLPSKEKSIAEKALHLLYKTFENFTKGKLTLEELRNPNKWARHYFPGEEVFTPSCGVIFHNQSV
jgi:hypothetical protein